MRTLELALNFISNTGPHGFCCDSTLAFSRSGQRSNSGDAREAAAVTANQSEFAFDDY